MSGQHTIVSRFLVNHLRNSTTCTFPCIANLGANASGDVPADTFVFLSSSASTLLPVDFFSLSHTLFSAGHIVLPDSRCTTYDLESLAGLIFLATRKSFRSRMREEEVGSQ